MIERTPCEAPRKCFGIEQFPSNHFCQTCDVKEECSKYMGKRLLSDRVDKTRFNLVPEALSQVDLDQDYTFQLVYTECYSIIFGDLFKPDSLHKSPGLRLKVEADAAELKCSIKTFMLTTMWAFKQVNPLAPFYCTMLQGNSAKNRVERYKADVEREYGTFDEKSMSDYGIEVGSSSESQILTGETIAGSWLVGYKIKKPGDAIPIFYEMNEHQLPDLWLALEPSYLPILERWRDDKTGCSFTVNKKRASVARLLTDLKRKSKQPAALFKVREQLMPRVIASVLRNRGFEPNNFRSSPKVWTSTLDFWVKLALAIQHVYCFQYLHGDDRIAEKALRSI